MTPEITLIEADVLAGLRLLPDRSVQCVVTSPPYWGLRDYGVSDQFGLEPTPNEYVANIVQVFREVWRVLRDDGVLWLNLGDSYARLPSRGQKFEGGSFVGSDTNGARTDIRMDIPFGLKEKDLVGVPWRVAFALQADGWYLRSDIIWSKPNPMPESVTDRPTKAHEYLFLLSKSSRYYYDHVAVKEPLSEGSAKRHEYHFGGHKNEVLKATVKPTALVGERSVPNGRNRRTVWTIVTAPYKGAHFATFPPALVEPCILAGTSEHGCCSVCGAPWQRVIKKGQPVPRPANSNPVLPYSAESGHTNGQGATTLHMQRTTETLGWRPTCSHGAEVVPCKVLDPFSGAGTTGLVAYQHGRDFVGIDLNGTYLDLTEQRYDKKLPEGWRQGYERIRIESAEKGD